ncbi:MAG: response regulator [Sporomusaceae bacterium]|nr:response regulator [Sporomusaceae bacterium]
MDKLLIVDDEKLERKALTFIIEKHCPNIQIIAEAGDGASACELAALHKPDIVLMDIRMPGMNGLDAAKQIHEQLPDTCIVILTAFDEFSYAKAALKIGAVEYLLKPVRPDDIIATLGTVSRKISAVRAKKIEEEQLRASVTAALPFIQMSFVYDLISGSICDKETLRERYRFLGVPVDPSVALVADIDNFRQITRQGTELERQVIKQKVHHYIKQLLGSDVLVTPLGSDNFIILLSFVESNETMIEKLAREKAALIRDSIATDLNLSVTIGIGNYYKEICEIHKSYVEAVAAKRQRFYFGDNQIIHIKDIPHLTEGPLQYPFQYERVLLEQIRCGDRTKAQEALGLLLNEIFSKHASIEIVKACVLELIIVTSRAAVEGGASLEKLTLLNFNYLDQLQECTNKQQVEEWLHDLLDKLVDNMLDNRASMNVRVIHKACEYIVRNYHKNISLEEVAQTVHLSPFYFSRLFKQERGYNFVDFLTKVRIDKAKKMLQNSDYTAVRIATEVGYKDASYFSRVFRQAVEMTPNQYRHAVRSRQSEKNSENS